MAYAEEDALKDYQIIFDAVDYGMKTRRLTSTGEVTSFMQACLVTMVGKALHDGDEKKVKAFVEKSEDIVKNVNKAHQKGK